MLAILRARQLFGGAHAIPGLRQALGLAEDGADERATVDQTEAKARELVAALQATGWDPSAADRLTGNADAAAVLRFAATEVIPRLAGTATEIEQVLRALDGRFIPAGPSGSPLRGLVNVLPTGRNFYSVDPKAVPSRLAWEAGVALADSLLARYRDEHGRWPRSVGLSVWAPRRCARPATTSPKCLRCWGFGRYGTTPRGGSSTWRPCSRPSWAARAST